jgi:hypothetical protein
MSSVPPSLGQFIDNLTNLTPEQLRELLNLNIPYCTGFQENPENVQVFLNPFKEILDAMLQLQVCDEHNGITRDNAQQFIALFDGLLTPTVEAATVRSETVGQEIRRILNHMALSMPTL